MPDQREPLSPFERRLVDLVRAYSDQAIAPTDAYAITSARPARAQRRTRWPAFPAASPSLIIFGLVLVALIMAIVVMAGLASVRSRPLPILYSSGSQLHVLDPTTGADTVLRGAPASPSWPTWSPDRKHLAYVAEGGSGDRTLWVANSDGQGAQSLGAVWVESGARYAWAPAGDQLAIQRPGCCLDIVDTGGTVTRRLFISGFKDSGAPSWSPDGASVALTGSDRQIVVCDLATGQTRHLSGGTTFEYGPQWSPDGSTIAFSADTGPMDAQGLPLAGMTSLDTIRVDGSGWRVLVSARVYGDAWARDGHALAAVAWHAESAIGPDDSVLSVVDPVTGLITTSLSIPPSMEIAWSPDGTHLAYLTISGDLWTVRADGTDPHRVAVRVTGFDW